MSHEEYGALGEAKRHEWYDGMCVVNPPHRPHIRANRRVAQVLDDFCPPGYEILQEGGWRTAEGDVTPDLMVAREDAPAVDWLMVPPLVVVEVLSRTTRSEDLVTKRRKYAAAGAPWYWVVDPDGPEVVVLRNDGGTFVEVRRVGPGRREPAVGPFPAPLDPDALFA